MAKKQSDVEKALIGYEMPEEPAMADSLAERLRKQINLRPIVKPDLSTEVEVMFEGNYDQSRIYAMRGVSEEENYDYLLENNSLQDTLDEGKNPDECVSEVHFAHMNLTRVELPRQYAPVSSRSRKLLEE